MEVHPTTIFHVKSLYYPQVTYQVQGGQWGEKRRGQDVLARITDLGTFPIETWSKH